MSTTATKIELVTEAIEALVLATIVATIPADQFPGQRAANHQNILDARGVVARSLAELLTPTLRVISSPPRETIPAPGARPAYPVA